MSDPGVIVHSPLVAGALQAGALRPQTVTQPGSGAGPAQDVRYRFVLPFTTERDLALYVYLAWGVIIPNRSVCPGHTSPWRAFADAYFARVGGPGGRPASTSVWKASRGFGGKSMLMAALGLTEATTLGDEGARPDVSILGGSGEQAARVHEAMNRMWNHASAPRHLLASDPSRTLTHLTHGNTIKALMASQTSVRGPHPARLRFDEVDESDQEIFDAATGQTLALTKDGRILVEAHTVLSSTHQYPDGMMTVILGMAMEKGWPVYEWCFKETMASPRGWLLPSEVERKRGETTTRMWQVEVELQEPSAEGRAIDTACVEFSFDPKRGSFDGADGKYLEFEAPAPREFTCSACDWHGPEEDPQAAQLHNSFATGHRVMPAAVTATYATGVDWAKETDWTIIDTLRTDVRPFKRVAWERLGRLPWPQMIARLDERMRRYPGKAAHDATGIGNVVSDYISIPAEGVIMVGRTRGDLFGNYIGAIERLEITGPRVLYAHREHKFATYADLYGAGHPPDTIVAGALANYAAGRGGTMRVW